MKLYEFQAKELFKDYQIPVPYGKVALNMEEAETVIKAFPHFPMVVKAQVHTGGRGKAGGVKVVKSVEEGIEKARAILSMKIKNFPVNKLLMEEAVDIEKELYLSFIQDRDSGAYKMIFSEEGGMDIEELAANEPEKILVQTIENYPGLMGFHIRNILFSLKDVDAKYFKDLSKLMSNLYDLFIKEDATLAEINPIILTKDGKVYAADGKVDIDDNALFRHKNLLSFKDTSVENPLELAAKEKHLNYVKLDGKIGCMVNGAGLAMATMDVIKYFGGEPANFLDIGGGAKSQQVKDALEIILNDKDVSAIFVNIFGGIVRCDLVAEGIIAAKKDLGIDKPMVIRLIGTNDEKAYAMLKSENINVFTTMNEAAEKVVNLASKIGE